MSSRLKLYEEAKLQNEQQWPKIYTKKFLEQGLVDYSDSDYGTLLLSKETIDALIPSFLGKPVIIKHFEVTPDNFLDYSVGNITNIYFNPTDGWYYVDFCITHDEGHKKLDEGWGVSCFYSANKKFIEGKYHNIPYHGEIVGGAGEHLALVPNPRYEECLEDVSAIAAMNVDKKPAYLYNATNYLNKRKQPTEIHKSNKILKIYDDSSQVLKVYYD